MFLEVIASLVVLLLGLVLWGRAAFARERECKRNGTFASQFVLIADDGTAHELSEEQKTYLNTAFHPADGARPYFKTRYSQLTPTGNVGGYLKRSRVPRKMPIEAPVRGL